MTRHALIVGVALGMSLFASAEPVLGGTMNEDPAALRDFKLFRPLVGNSPFYTTLEGDAALAESIVDWASSAILGGNEHDLRIRPEWVFQIPSHIPNRSTYLTPIFDRNLLRQVVLSSKYPTKRASAGCGQGDPKHLDFPVGFLVLKRSFFRGSGRFLSTHESPSGWFVADHYYLDIISQASTRDRESESKVGRRDRAVFRVFYDSIGCAPLVTFEENPWPGLNSHLDDVYFPSANEVVLDWHELAVLLGETNTGLYVLANAQSKLESGFFERVFIVGNLELPAAEIKVFGIDEDDPQQQSQWLDPRSIQANAPLPSSLCDTYQAFSVKYFQRPQDKPIEFQLPQGTQLGWGLAFKLPFTVNTHVRTPLPQGLLGDAIVTHLEEEGENLAEYLGNGVFRVRAENTLPLAAGTGQWNSPESKAISFAAGDVTHTQGTEGGNTQKPPGNPGTPGVDRPVIGWLYDRIRAAGKRELDAQLKECRATGTTAECEGCMRWTGGHALDMSETFFSAAEVAGGLALCALGPYWCAPAGIPLFIDGVRNLVEKLFKKSGDPAESDDLGGDLFFRDWVEEQCTGLSNPGS